jgi:glycosyltransferase involved in cell wall biosynthesis
MQAVARTVARRGDVHYRAVSAYARDTNCALMRFPPERVTVVPRGIDFASLPAPAPRSTWGLPDGVPLVVNVARLVPEKAQHPSGRRVRRRPSGPARAVLAIVGSPGSAEPDVKAAIERHGLGDAVRLLGFRDDARTLIAAADVFAFSSLSEGSPGAVLEALALGTRSPRSTSRRSGS